MLAPSRSGSRSFENLHKKNSELVSRQKKYVHMSKLLSRVLVIATLLLLFVGSQHLEPSWIPGEPFEETTKSVFRYIYPFHACKPPKSASDFLHSLQFVQLWRSSKVTPDNGITIVTQLSIERLEGLAMQCSVWSDRIAAVVYLPLSGGKIISLEEGKKGSSGGMTLTAAKQVLKNFHDRLEADEMCALDIELVVENFADPDDPYAFLYPFNALRNRALMMPKTEAILLLDADFLPSAGLASTKQAPALHKQLLQQLEDKSAIVLPAFSIGDPNKLSLQYIKDSTMEHYKKLALGAALLGKKFVVECYNDGQLLMAASYYYPAQGPTDFDRWVRTNSSYDIEYARFFEPYVIVHRKYVPWYDERFRGYGNDKVQHLAQIAGFGVTFRVHPTEYAIHLPHRHSATRKATVTSPHHHSLVVMHEQVEKEIEAKTYIPVTSFSDLPWLCPNKENRTSATFSRSSRLAAF